MNMHRKIIKKQMNEFNKEASMLRLEIRLVKGQLEELRKALEQEESEMVGHVRKSD